MIDNKKISVLITSHKLRFNTLDIVINSWLNEPIDELWIIDDGTGFKSSFIDNRLLIFNMPKDFETRADYCLALMADGDLIIMADDDVVVKSGFTLDLYNGYKKTNGIVGIAGKEFFGPRYIRDTKIYKSYRISEPKEVGFIGIIFMSPREYFGFDVRGMHKNCDDFWFCMKEHPELKKYVVPTKNYYDLPSSETRNIAMHRTSNLKRPRFDFYTKYYNLNYKDKQQQIQQTQINNNIDDIDEQLKKEKREAKLKSREIKQIWKDLIKKK